MARQIVAGIDIGTSEVRVVITEGLIEHGRMIPKVIGTGSCESRGMCRGYIASPKEAARSVEIAVKRAEKTAGTRIKRAYASFGGIGLGAIVSSGAVAISRPNMEINERDLALVLEAAEAAIPTSASLNKKIINTVPIEYKIDGKVVWGEASGLKAQKLEVKALFITCIERHLSDLISTIEDAGVEVVDVVAAPVALSFVTLSKKQKRVGCLLADIGAETTSIVVFENNNLISLEIFPVGASDITNDIALGLKVSLEDAESIKLGNDRGISYSKKKLDDIITVRLKSCFESIDGHLKAIGRNALLPAGIILAGGGAFTPNIKSVAENSLKLPAQVAEVYFGAGAEGKIKDRAWGIACGLSLVGFDSDDERRSIGIRSASNLLGDGRRWGKAVSRWISQFLP